MVIVAILASWVGLSVVLCLAFAAVAARKRPLVGETIPAEAESPDARSLAPAFRAVCATP